MLPPYFSGVRWRGIDLNYRTRLPFLACQRRHEWPERPEFFQDFRHRFERCNGLWVTKRALHRPHSPRTVGRR